MFSVLVIRLRSLRLLRVSGIVMRLRMFLLLRSEERFSRNAETDLVCRLLLEKKNTRNCIGSEGVRRTRQCELRAHAGHETHADRAHHDRIRRTHVEIWI